MVHPVRTVHHPLVSCELDVVTRWASLRDPSSEYRTPALKPLPSKMNRSTAPRIQSDAQWTL
jgi:hypothetical protein